MCTFSHTHYTHFKIYANAGNTLNENVDYPSQCYRLLKSILILKISHSNPFFSKCHIEVRK